MRMSRSLPIAAAIVGCVTACESPTANPQLVDAQFASNGTPVDASSNTIDFAVIGDVPYGASAAALFPTLIESINVDPHVRRAVHLGDTKSGSTECTDEWFGYILDSFNSFKDPLVYTPGDNEWTDCHRPNNGGYNPIERLTKIREVYFSTPGQTLGRRSKTVESQAGYPENQMWMESQVVFAAIHLIGSNNNLDAWTDETPDQTVAREAEWAGREAANRAWLGQAFDLAESRGAAGVVIFSHGDMWHPEDVEAGVSFSGHQAFVELLATRAAAFELPVILFAGDSHDYRVDQPLVGDTNYGAPDAPNLTQITVERSIEGTTLIWLKLHVDPRSDGVFSWEQVVVQ